MQADAKPVLFNICYHCDCLASDVRCAAGLFHLAMACGFTQRHQFCQDIMDLAEDWQGSEPALGHRPSSGELKPLNHPLSIRPSTGVFSSGSVCAVPE